MIYDTIPWLMLIIAVITRKDLAIAATVVAWAGVYVWGQEWSASSTIVASAALNTGLAMAAVGHRYAEGCKLSLVVGWLSACAVIANFLQAAYFTNEYLSMLLAHTTGFIGFAICASLVIFDGRRGLLRDLYNDVGSCVHRHTGLSVGQGGNKGAK